MEARYRGESTAVMQRRWFALMQALEFAPNESTHNDLIAAYGQRHRKYHNIDHLIAVLDTLQSISDQAKDANAIALALWFHDAVYKIFSKTNELDSAVLARKFVNANSGNLALADCVYSHIMATEHNSVPADTDAQLLVDIDLAILGRDAVVYDQFEANIRKEYRYVPWPVYRKNRIAILQGFLNRTQIYSHKHFVENFEQGARANLARAIQQLQNA